MKHTITFGWGTPGNANNFQVVNNVEIDEAGELNLDVPITSNQTNKQINFALDVSQVKLFVIMATQNMVVKTNSSGSPANTFTLVKDVPYFWTVGNGTLTDTAGTTLVDVTTIYATNTTAGTLRIRSLVDPTP